MTADPELEEETDEAAQRRLEDETRAVLKGIAASHGLAADREQEGKRQRDLAEKLAALLTRRMTNQHGCSGKSCRHVDHRRDVFYALEMLDTLGLSHAFPNVTEEDRAEFTGSVAERIPRHGFLPGEPKKRWNRGTNERH